MKENFPNLVKEIYTQVQEAQRVPNKMDAESSPARYVIIKMPNIKDKKDNLKGCKTKAVS